ncbi:UNVERIFIED_CONTAM: hypothetical protein Slati_1373500 [Sesamum latifolium]|uniref:Uncharacterized protein n=1 Tax=Sesamum latifolium TaxID=2727402 RepID=A0AAW2XJ88_9LAMI
MQKQNFQKQENSPAVQWIASGRSQVTACLNSDLLRSPIAWSRELAANSSLLRPRRPREPAVARASDLLLSQATSTCKSPATSTSASL